MDKKIFEFVAKRDTTNLESYLDGIDVELKKRTSVRFRKILIKSIMKNWRGWRLLSRMLAEFVRQQLNDDKSLYDEQKGCFPLICAVFRGSAFEELRSEEKQIEIEKLRDRRRVMIMMEIVKWLSEKGNETTSLFDKLASDLVGQCINEMSVGSCNSPIVIESFVEATKIIIRRLQSLKPIHGKLFAFLPMFLSTFDTLPEVNEPPSDNSSSCISMSGPDYKDYILNKICSIKWNPSNVLSLTGEFRDIVMTNEQLKFIVEKIMRQFDLMDVNGMPPLIYQMLLLSRK
ncbi:11884_t:CDS:2, partial [Acaulospora morrowiae]